MKEIVTNEELHEDCSETKKLPENAQIILDNWYQILNKNLLKNESRQHILELTRTYMKFKNEVSDFIDKTDLMYAINTITEVSVDFDFDSEWKDELKKLSLEIEFDKDIQIKNKNPNNTTTIPTMSEISPATMVCLVSDPSKKGAVIKKEGTKYTVFIDNALGTYYREQIIPIAEEDEKNLTPIEDVRSALTAYYISKPCTSNLYSLNAARIDFVPYQFRPALKLIKSDNPRILIADDVGVGKTIEAGIILKEMEARSKIESVLIICPRPLVSEKKWEREMKRFDEDFISVDGPTLKFAIDTTDKDGYWPERYSKIIVPYSLFNETLYTGIKTKTGKYTSVGLSNLEPLPHFDLVIVDEAHYIRNSNTWAYKCVETLCTNATSVVFMTATPLQNSNNDLYTLLNLLRPDVVVDRDVFQTMAKPNLFINKLLFHVRSMDKDWKTKALEQVNGLLSTDWGRDVIPQNPVFPKIMQKLSSPTLDREQRVSLISEIESLHTFDGIINRTRRRDIEDFCIRRNQTVEINFTDLQRQTYNTLIDFEKTYLIQKHGTRNVFFMMCMLMRQASSCIYGLVPFVKYLISVKLEEADEVSEYDDIPEKLDSDILNELLEKLFKQKQELDNDPKFDRLCEIITEKQKESNNKVIVFSTFRNTLAYLNTKLTAKGFRVKQVDGSVPDQERYEYRQRFKMDRSEPRSIDVLLFSEVGCEGLDYQFCDTMVNYDLPWNPMKIEQRIGRIDRHGQKSPTVRIYNMITKDTIDDIVFNKCLNKIGIFQENIGDCAEILGDIHSRIMEIMMDPSLSDTEKAYKMEALADNKIRENQEIQRLERDQKTLFGFDLKEYIKDTEVQNAENPWLSPSAIQEMVEKFLCKKYGQIEYIRGKGPGKMLRLSSDVRKDLFEKCRSEKKINQTTGASQWLNYLKSDNPATQITFDSEYAKENPNAVFINMVHPLTVEAAKTEKPEKAFNISLKYASDKIPTGCYRFRVYAWEYIGLRDDVYLKTICSEESIVEEIQNILNTSADIIDTPIKETQDDELEETHYKIWSETRKQHIEDVQAEYNYRIKQLEQSASQRKTVLERLKNATNDENIRSMRQRQINNLDSQLQRQKYELEEKRSRADLHAKLLINGIVTIN